MGFFSDDPEDTLFLTLTQEEVALVTSGLLLSIGRATEMGLPEVVAKIQAVGTKVSDAIRVQKSDSFTS